MPRKIIRTNDCLSGDWTISDGTTVLEFKLSKLNEGELTTALDNILKKALNLAEIKWIKIRFKEGEFFENAIEKLFEIFEAYSYQKLVLSFESVTFSDDNLFSEKLKGSKITHLYLNFFGQTISDLVLKNLCDYGLDISQEKIRRMDLSFEQCAFDNSNSMSILKDISDKPDGVRFKITFSECSQINDQNFLNLLISYLNNPKIIELCLFHCDNLNNPFRQLTNSMNIVCFKKRFSLSLGYRDITDDEFSCLVKSILIFKNAKLECKKIRNGDLVKLYKNIKALFDVIKLYKSELGSFEIALSSYCLDKNVFKNTELKTLAKTLLDEAINIMLYSDVIIDFSDFKLLLENEQSKQMGLQYDKYQFLVQRNRLMKASFPEWTQEISAAHYNKIKIDKIEEFQVTTSPASLKQITATFIYKRKIDYEKENSIPENLKEYIRTQGEMSRFFKSNKLKKQVFVLDEIPCKNY